MKNYDPTINNGTHEVKVTIQQWDYVGHIFFTIDGNYKGSDCNLAFNKEGECFTATLKNEVGDILVVEGDANEFNDMMVAVELTDYYEEESQLSKTKIYPRRKP